MNQDQIKEVKLAKRSSNISYDSHSDVIDEIEPCYNNQAVQISQIHQYMAQIQMKQEELKEIEQKKNEMLKSFDLESQCPPFEIKSKNSQGSMSKFLTPMSFQTLSASN